ncbi:hypothetical protein DITRI_Ditri03aG0109200 [Diplodiscus trichospermus]
MFAQSTPQEKAKRKLETLEALKKTFKKLDHDVNIQEFLGATKCFFLEMTNEVSMLQVQLTEVHKRLSYWSNPDKIDNVEHLRQMEDSLRESIERIQIHKENYGKHHLMSVECTSQFQSGMPLPMMIGGLHEARPISWLANNENHHMLLHNEPNFLPDRDTKCSADGSLVGYSGFFVSGKQTKAEMASPGQVDNAVRESKALNELESNACFNLEPGEQYFYAPYSASNMQDREKLKPEMEVNLQENPGVYQVISNLEIPRPMYNGGHPAWVSSSGPCSVTMFDGSSYHQALFVFCRNRLVENILENIDFSEKVK